MVTAAGSSVTIKATDGTHTGTSNMFTVNHTTASSVAISPANSAVTAGSSVTYSAKASDAYGNTWDVTPSSTWGINSGAGGSWSSNVYTSASAGTWTVTCIYTSWAYTTGLTVNAAVATHFVVAGFPSPTTAGTAHSVSVTAKDAYGNTATSYAGMVKITSSDGKAVLPANAGLSSGVGSFAVTLETAGTQSITATDTVTSSIYGSQIGITVNAGTVASVAISPANSAVTAGSSVTYSAKASDAYGNTWDVTSSSTWGINSGAGGSWSSNVYTSSSAGTWTVTCIYSSWSYTTGLTVNPAGLDHFVFNTVGTQTAGTAFSITVTAKDAYGNTATGYTGKPSLTYSAGSISPGTMNAFISGVGTTSVTVTTAGSSVTIKATDGTHSGTSNSFTVNAATVALDHFVFSHVGTQTAGKSFSITVTAKDASGNTITSYTGTPTLTYSAGSISPTTMKAFVNGVGTTTVTVTAAGSSVTIMAQDGTHSGSSNGFTVNPAGLNHFTFNTISSPQTVDKAFRITITAKDAYGNTVTSYTGTNTLSESTGTISPTRTGAFSSGTWTGLVTLSGAASAVTLSTSGSGMSGTSNSFTVNSGVLDHFTFNTIKSPQTAGTAFSITITAKDDDGNTVTSYTGTNALSVSTGTISPTRTGSFSNGVWTGSVKLSRAGTRITISTTGSGESGTSNSFTVNAAGTALNLVLIAFTTVAAAITISTIIANKRLRLKPNNIATSVIIANPKN